MPQVLVETSVVDAFGNAYVDGSGNAVVVLVATVVSTQLPPIPGREWQWSDHLAEPDRLKTRW